MKWANPPHIHLSLPLHHSSTFLPCFHSPQYLCFTIAFISYHSSTLPPFFSSPHDLSTVISISSYPSTSSCHPSTFLLFQLSSLLLFTYYLTYLLQSLLSALISPSHPATLSSFHSSNLFIALHSPYCLSSTITFINSHPSTLPLLFTLPTYLSYYLSSTINSSSLTLPAFFPSSLHLINYHLRP